MANGDNFNTDEEKSEPSLGKKNQPPKVMGGRRLFTPKNPGSPGKLSLGKTSTTAQSLSKLRGKGAVA